MTKDPKENLILWCQGSFALLRCFRFVIWTYLTTIIINLTVRSIVHGTITVCCFWWPPQAELFMLICPSCNGWMVPLSMMMSWMTTMMTTNMIYLSSFSALEFRTQTAGHQLKYNWSQSRSPSCNVSVSSRLQFTHPLLIGIMAMMMLIVSQHGNFPRSGSWPPQNAT